MIIDAPLGEPCGVGMGVAAVWVMMGGVRTPGWSDVGGAEPGSSFVTDTDGGSPNIFFSVSTQEINYVYLRWLPTGVSHVYVYIYICHISNIFFSMFQILIIYQ